MRILVLAAALVALFAAAVAAAAPVAVPADPPRIETWDLHEVWRVDGDDPDAPLIGVPNSAAVDAAGDLLLLDAQLSHVLVFAPDGAYLRTLGGEGEGPGEIRRAQLLVPFADGAVGMLQSFPCRVVKLAPDGTPLPSLDLGSGVMLWQVVADGDGIVGNGQIPNFSGEGPTQELLARFSAGGERVFTYVERSRTIDWDHLRYDEAATWWPGYLWDLTADGTLVIGPERDRYLIEWRDPDGRTLRAIERPFTCRARTDADIAEVASRVTYSRDGVKLEPELKIAPRDAALRGLRVCDDGTLWVRSCYFDKDLPEGTARRYDVFEPDGRFRAEVRLDADFDPERDTMSLLRDGRFLLVRNGVNAAMSMYAPDQRNDEDEKLSDEDLVVSVALLARAE